MARRLEVEIIGDASSLTRALGKAHGSTGKFGGALGKLGKIAAGAGVALAGGLAVAAKIAFDEISEAQQVTAKTNAVIKSTGGVAKVTTKEVLALSESLMLKSGADDEAIQSGANMLLTFKQIRNEAGKGNDIFNQATGAVLDLSVAMGKDMQDSAILVGKALNDPIRGLAALRRVGIQFTAGQEKQIKKMVEAGNVMGAQKLILRELNSEFGGAAEAVGQTLPGQFNILKESAKNLLAEGFQPLIPMVTDLVVWFTEHLPQIRHVAKRVFEGVKTVVQEVGGVAFAALKPVVSGVISFFRENWPEIRRVGGNVLGGLRDFIVNRAIPAFDRLRGFIRDVVAKIVKVFRENKKPLTEIWGNVKSIVGDVVEIFQDLAPLLRKVIPGAIRAAIPVLQTLTTVLSTLFGWASALSGAISDVVRQLDKIKGFSLSDIKGPSLLDIVGRQHGGPVAGRRPYIVGERGPELFVPRSAGTVIPNSRLRGAGGGGAIVVPVYLDGRQIAEAMFDPLRHKVSQYKSTNGGRSPL